jgi:hypothetical protein
MEAQAEAARKRKEARAHQGGATDKAVRRPEPDQQAKPSRTRIRAATATAPADATETRERPSAEREPEAPPAAATDGSGSSLGRGIAIAVAVLAVGGAAGMLAGSLTESDADTAAPTGDTTAAYERALDREVAALDNARAAEFEELQAAGNPGDQSSASKDLAATHRQAARSLEAIDAPAPMREPAESLAITLMGVADAYQRLAGAAKNRDPDAFKAGQGAVRQAETDLQESLKALRDS